MVERKILSDGKVVQKHGKNHRVGIPTTEVREIQGWMIYKISSLSDSEFLSVSM